MDTAARAAILILTAAGLAACGGEPAAAPLTGVYGGRFTDIVTPHGRERLQREAPRVTAMASHFPAGMRLHLRIRPAQAGEGTRMVSLLGLGPMNLAQKIEVSSESTGLRLAGGPAGLDGALARLEGRMLLIYGPGSKDRPLYRLPRLEGVRLGQVRGVMESALDRRAPGRGEPGPASRHHPAPAAGTEVSRRAGPAENVLPVAVGTPQEAHGVRLTVMQATITPVEVIKGRGGRSLSRDPLLRIRFRVQNISRDRTLDFRGSPLSRLVRLHDAAGRPVRRVTFGYRNRVAGAMHGGTTLEPAEEAGHVEVFRVPEPGSQPLILSVDLALFGGTGEAAFLLTAEDLGLAGD